MKSKTMVVLSDVALIMGVIIFSGCASIVSRSEYPVSVSSNPSGAIVSVTNKQGIEITRSTTPIRTSLKMRDGYFSGQRYTFEFEKEGYYPQTVILDTKLDGWYFGNFCFGGLIGLLIVDPLTGAMWRVDDTLHIHLAPIPGYQPAVEEKKAIEPEKVTATPPPAEPTIVDQLKQLRELRDLEIITEDEYEERRSKLIEQL